MLLVLQYARNLDVSQNSPARSATRLLRPVAVVFWQGPAFGGRILTGPVKTWATILLSTLR